MILYIELSIEQCQTKSPPNEFLSILKKFLSKRDNQVNSNPNLDLCVCTYYSLFHQEENPKNLSSSPTRDAYHVIHIHHSTTNQVVKMQNHSNWTYYPWFSIADKIEPK